MATYTYPKLPNINRLQRINAKGIEDVINTLPVDSATERGEDLANTSLISDILYAWAKEFSVKIKASAIAHEFNPDGSVFQTEPHVLDEAGVLKVLQIDMPDHWRWAEFGRGKSTRKGAVPLWQILENWITYRGINVRTVNQWTRKVKTKDGTKLIKPYAKITDTLKLRRTMAQAFAQSIHKKGTIKRFGQKGSYFIKSVLTEEELNGLSRRLSEAVGYNIVISII